MQKYSTHKVKRIYLNSHLSGHVKMLVDSVDRGDLICLGETFGLLIVLIQIWNVDCDDSNFGTSNLRGHVEITVDSVDWTELIWLGSFSRTYSAKIALLIVLIRCFELQT